MIPRGKAVIAISLLIILIFCTLLQQRSEAVTQLSESQAKAVFVYNIIRYVTWPKGAFKSEAVIEVGILTKSSGDASWNILKGNSVQGRKVVIRKSSDIDDLRSCQIIYMENSARKELVRALNSIKQEPILTISDMDKFHMHDGGMITLSVINSKLTFAINLATARKSSLDISSHLLKLAHEVVQ